MSWFEVMLTIGFMAMVLISGLAIAVVVRWLRSIEQTLDDVGMRIFEINRAQARTAHVIRLDDFRKGK